MPTPQEFMEQVVAWPGPDGPGYVNLHWTSPKGPGMRGKPFKDVHSFMDMAQYAALKPAIYKEIYFCLSTQSATGKLVHGNPTAARLKQNALKLKAIWIDVDVKPGDPKHYATILETLDAIDTFVTAAKLPPPSALVFSGGGVHVYWFSDIALTPDEWRPYAEGLKAEAVRLGLKCDAPLTTDEARVLRVPGTYNNKSLPPRAVRLAHLGASYKFATDLAMLAAIVPVNPTPATAAVTTGARAALPFDLSNFPTGGMAKAFHIANLNPQFDSLAEGVGLHSDLPLKLDEVVRKCEHFQDAAATQGRLHSEPLWNLTVLASTWFEDGRDIAHYFSKGHPAYIKGGAGETDKKFDEKLTARARGTGWPSCSQFEAAGAKCKTCPFYGKLRSPLNLAERAQLPFVVAQPAPPPPDDLFLPPGYTVDTEKRICKIVQKTLSNGVTTEEAAPLFYCQIRNPVAQRGVRKFMFDCSLDGGTWGQVVLYETDFSTEQTLVKAMRTHGCKPYPDNQRGLVQFMTAWTAKLDEAKKRLNTISFGWLRKEEGGEMPIGFAYGGRVVMAGQPDQQSGFTDAQIEQAYKPKGSPAPWIEAIEVVTSQMRPANECIIAMSFGAPLMFATGLYNGVFCAWSPESAAHKSTSISIGGAVWASPNLSKVRQISSPKGIVRKIGHIKNLPVYLDEIAEVEKMDEVRLMVNVLSEGGDGDKLHQDRTFYEMETWQTLMLVGSNQSLCENIMRNVTGTDAKLQRVFEFQVPKRDASHDENHVTTLINSLDYNYGHMGLTYSKLLGADPAGIKAFVREQHDRFNQEVAFQTEERFRSAMAVTTYCGAALANALLPTHARFHLPEMWDFLKEQFLLQRTHITKSASVGGTAANTVNQMTQMVKHYVRNVLTVQSLPVRQKGHPVAVAYISGPTKDRVDRIHVRCAITERYIDVSRGALSAYITLVKGSSGAVIEGLIKHYNAVTMEKIDLAAGAGVQGGRETIIRIPVPPGSPFEGILFTNVPMDARPLSTNDGEEEGPATAAVTEPVPSGLLGGGAVAAAVTQAAKDLDLVTKS